MSQTVSFKLHNSIVLTFLTLGNATKAYIFVPAASYGYIKHVHCP